MKLSEFKSHLNSLETLHFSLPDGTNVPDHFHVTEVGQVIKHFIDCGGTVRHEKVVSFQLWEAGDYDHHLAPQKLSAIIALSEKVLGVEDAEIEVEYQGNTIGKYGMDFKDGHFLLTAKQTNCLASDACGIPPEKMNVKLKDPSVNQNSCCTPGSNCC
ncbi:MAG: hypothetical protein K0R26_2479 [Bacteroidota bacterium]|jgi:hypothetical protein|nr:hypothetical protein [Bacteroidota bacterium]